MTLAAFNQSQQQAYEALFACCGCTKWATEMMRSFPFSSEEVMVERATDIWYNHCAEADFREAFTHHPQIGDVKSLQEKFAATSHLAGAEQGGVNSATTKIIEELATANNAYVQKFGFIFIVCATGKSADEMLRLLNDRLQNNANEELAIAMGEQHKITIIRLQKLLNESDWSFLKNSQLTTHVLDTSIGKPGKNITIKLQQPVNGNWQTIAQGVTNADGRIPDMLPPLRTLGTGIYKMFFETKTYFEKHGIKGFYPAVEIQFTIFDAQHYHVPLLINPFGYSTYRGS